MGVSKLQCEKQSQHKEQHITKYDRFHLNYKHDRDISDIKSSCLSLFPQLWLKASHSFRDLHFLQLIFTKLDLTIDEDWLGLIMISIMCPLLESLELSVEEITIIGWEEFEQEYLNCPRLDISTVTPLFLKVRRCLSQHFFVSQTLSYISLSELLFTLSVKNRPCDLRVVCNIFLHEIERFRQYSVISPETPLITSFCGYLLIQCQHLRPLSLRNIPDFSFEELLGIYSNSEVQSQSESNGTVEIRNVKRGTRCPLQSLHIHYDDLPVFRYFYKKKSFMEDVIEDWVQNFALFWTMSELRDVSVIDHPVFSWVYENVPNECLDEKFQEFDNISTADKEYKNL